MNEIAPEVLEKVLPEKREAFRRFVGEAHRQMTAVEARFGRDTRITKIWRHAVEIIPDTGNLHKFRALRLMNKTPVDIDEFLESPEFLGDLMEVWPRLKDDIRRMNPDVMLGEKPCNEALLGGATGTGKTTLTTATNCYQPYLFSCFDTPQLMYGLSPVTPLVFMMQSVSAMLTKRIIYRPLRQMFTAMPHTKKWINWNRQVEHALLFENGVQMVPALANIDSILGQAIPGGIVDEVNFMKLIQNSTQVAGPRGQGGTFDQAREIYTNLTRRRQRSFQTKGYSFGVLCFLSSTRYKNDFLDQRMREVVEFDLPNITVIRRKQYEVVPQDRFSGEKFRLLVGSDSHPTRVLNDDDVPGRDYPENATVELVPIEYRPRFLTDPDGALRDICGIATDALSPFISQRNKIVDAIMRHKELKRPKMVVKDAVELQYDGMPQWDELALKSMSDAEKMRPRWAHIDLAIAKDSAAVSIVSLLGMTTVLRDDKVEVVPQFSVDAAVQIKPSASQHIEIADVRRWVMQLPLFYGINLEEVSYDGFQSTESMQVLRKAGIRSRYVSMDRTTEPYEYLRRTLYEDRIAFTESEPLKVELATLEENALTGKIDHPPGGSKDVADAVCGAVFCASQSRLVRTRTKVTEHDGTNAVIPKMKGRAPGRRRR